MKNRSEICISVAVVSICLTFGASVEVRTQAANPQDPGQTQTSQPAQQNLSPIQQLEKILTPEQREKIRAILKQSKEERETINRRVRQAQQALNEAIELDNPDEALIEQRAHELAEAQGPSIRLRALTEARIRQVLTPDQRVRLHELREQAQAIRREQRNQRKEQGTGDTTRPDAFQRRTTAPQIGPGSRGKAPQHPSKPR
jgi:Spy/CpxP family protein refolding chaperone